VALALVGESRAGAPARAAVGSGEAIAISTGAPVPDGADAVVPVEDTRPQGETTIAVLSAARTHQHIRDAGEDIRAGQLVLAAGTRLGAAELGVLGSLGCAEVLCSRVPRVAVLVTGDELLAAGEAPRAGGVHDSNSHSVPALARSLSAEVCVVRRVPDEPAATTEAIATGAGDADLLVICGGVSVGPHDHVKASLAALGARETFWGIALKPGRPTWFGTLADTLVFGLPGNPVSAMVTFALLVAPALAAMQGAAREPAPREALLGTDYEKRPGRAHAVRCRVEARHDGLHALPTGAQGSHILTSMLGADALAIIPREQGSVRRGEWVRIEPLPGRVAMPW
jgi:molybdopterin molybdotransferase